MIELGAQWVHGEEGNPVYRMADEAGEIRTDICTFESTGHADNVDCAYPQNGRKVSDKQLHQFRHVILDIYQSAAKDLAGWNKSLGEYFHLR